jgi:hypothetical protein
MTTFFRTSTLLVVILLFAKLATVAQSPLVKLFTEEKELPAPLYKYVNKGSVFTLDQTNITKLFLNKPASVMFSFRFENKEWLMEGQESDLFSKSFFVQTSDNRLFAYDQKEVLHYKGKIKGQSNAFFSISILHNEVIAVLADESGNINIGALSNGQAGSVKEHIIFRESNLVSKQPFECGTENLPAVTHNPLPQFAAPSATNAVINTEPVDIYFEADNSCYLNNGSNITNTVNWATALFNVVTTLYENDSLYTRMSGIKVWNTPDPYTALTTTSTVLYAFSSKMNAGFPGDLAQLLSQRGLGGGIAWLNVLCSSPYYRCSVSANLSNSFNPFPVYSWNTMVIAHELGHNIASNHTQWCGWPGGAIDNCYTTEGGCPQGPAPINGGTVMSYCHLTGYGINLANGFGPLPGAAIRNAVRTSTCIYPRISFNKNFESVTEETADIENNCLNYKLISLKLALNYTPTQPAIISLQPLAVASPTLEIGINKDVDISSLNFTLTDTTPQLIELKVYNDAIIENKETLKIDFSIAANGTNAVKNGTYLLDILSLDHRPDSTENQLLYYEPFDNISSGLGSWTQTIVHGAASPNRWIIGNNADPLFTTTAAFVSFNGTSAGYAGSTISDSAIIRLISPSINATGFSNMRLSYLYKCNGEGTGGQGTLEVAGIDFGRVYYSTNNGANWALLKDNIFGRNFKTLDELVLPSVANNCSTLKIAFEWLNNRSIVNNPSLIIDSIMIKGAGSSPVQTATHIANTAEANLGPGQTVHFYNPVTQNIMASISNKSNHNFGCTTLEIIRTGSNASIAWGDYAAQKVGNKSYRVISSNINADAPYEISLYYSNEEINGWATATGNETSEISIIKTSADITQSPPLTGPEFSNYNSIYNFGNSGDKVIKALFKGFSTFSIGKAGIAAICPGNSQQLAANETGLAYQWQVNTGGGFINLAENAVYTGTNAQTLTIINAPTSWYGNIYRCMINDAQGTHYSLEYLIKFALNWMGSSNNEWENISNWGCGYLPDGNTDVFIKTGAAFYPMVNAPASIRSLTVQSGASVNIQNGVQLNILQ